ncbi:MAG TPA: creatininase family protein [Bacteroidales bacterium]|nr:creatininase family protein [Bacteroidales bacterium]
MYFELFEVKTIKFTVKEILMTSPVNLRKSPWKRVQDIKYDVAVLPWGATEAHNFHLPFGTDIIETEYIAEKSAEKAWENGAKVVVLPAIPFGVNTSQLDIYMTINMNPGTQFRIIEDVLNSLSNHGITRFVIMNGHGGNDFKTIIRELQPRYPDIFIMQLNWFEAAPLKDYFEESGDHANEMETSVIMHIDPEIVLPLNEAGDGKAKSPVFKARREGWVWFPRAWTKVTEDTGIGNPKKATPEKGARYLEDITTKIADFFVELVTTDPENIYK